jgi:hypothetical protein
MWLLQEVCELLERPSLCVTSESTLVELCLAWAQENIQAAAWSSFPTLLLVDWGAGGHLYFIIGRSPSLAPERCLTLMSRIKPVLRTWNIFEPDPDLYFDIGTLWIRILPFFSASLESYRRKKLYRHQKHMTVPYYMFESKEINVIIIFSLN